MTDSDASLASGSVTETSIRKVLVMAEAFAATDKEDSVSWLKYFKNCANLNKWQEEEKRDFGALRRKSTSVYRTKFKPARSRGLRKHSARNLHQLSG